ncbi:MAG: PrgI family protein [Lachnospiraceae bacterium]|nr:PrgI family protein [Lachnospiraceae bacterium]
MLEVKPNKEILKIKNTMFLGFTGFQALMIGAGLITGTLLFLLLPFHPLINTFILVVVVVVFVTIGMIEINNMSLLKFIFVFIKNRRVCKRAWFFENGKEVLRDDKHS